MPVLNGERGLTPGGSPVHASSLDSSVPGVIGDSLVKDTTSLIPTFWPGSGDGVYGLGKNGVHGQSTSPTDSGVWGESTGAGYGVSGSTNSANAAGVWGDNQGPGPGHGVRGTSAGGEGVHGETNSQTWAGVTGIALNTAGTGPGVWAESKGKGPGIVAVNAGDVDCINATTNSQNHAAVAAHNNGGGFGLWAASDNSAGPNGGVGIYARGARYAAWFDGTVFAKTDIVLGSDCAEDFDVAQSDEIGPGTVMVLGDDGTLQTSNSPYDKKVAGVISGAGEYEPGLILGRRKVPSQERMPLALVGKVYCKVDAQYGSIHTGDLLTTSPTPGHAMRAADPLKAFGAVVGKALRSLSSGQGLVPILVALQ
jgi:hypothetical protein